MALPDAWKASASNVAESIGHWLVGDLYDTRPDLCGTLMDDTSNGDPVTLLDLYPDALGPFGAVPETGDEGFEQLLRTSGSPLVIVMDPDVDEQTPYQGAVIEQADFRVSITTLSAIWEDDDGDVARIDVARTRQEMRGLRETVTRMIRLGHAPLSDWSGGEPVSGAPMQEMGLRLVQGPVTREQDGRIDWTVVASAIRLRG